MEPDLLLNPESPEQGSGQLILEHFKLELFKEGLMTIKKKWAMPLFVQLEFRSDWLCHNACSFEKRIIGIESD